MKLSERILNNLTLFDEDQDEICLSYEDMEEGFKLGISFYFTSTDDYYQQIVDLENGLIAAPEGEPKFNRRQFKQIVSEAMDVFAFTRTYVGHEETIKELINSIE